MVTTFNATDFKRTLQIAIQQIHLGRNFRCARQSHDAPFCDERHSLIIHFFYKRSLIRPFGTGLEQSSPATDHLLQLGFYDTRSLRITSYFRLSFECRSRVVLS